MRSTRPILLLSVLAAAAGLVWWLAVYGGSGPRVAGPLPFSEVADEERARAAEAGGIAALEPAAQTPPATTERTPLVEETAPADPSGESAAPTQALAGRVVDAFGQPIAGARVLIAATAGLGPIGATQLDLVDERALPWMRRQELTSDAAGRFAFPGAPAGELALAVRAPGYAPLRTTREAGAGELGDLALEAAVVLSGRVLDAAGRTVPEAELRLLLSALPGLPEALRFASTPPWTQTDATGAFRIDELAAGPYLIVVTHPEHPPGRLEGATERPGEVQGPLLITLPEGGTIAGRVVGLEPGVASELLVRARPSAGLAGLSAPTASERSAPVAADASFLLRGLARDTEYRLGLTAADGGQPFGGQRSASAVARTGEQGVELRLSAQVVVQGRALDATTGAPILRFEVRAGAPWLELLGASGGAEEHPDGRFRYAGVPYGSSARSLGLRLSAEGYAPLVLEHLEVPADRVVELGELRLTPVPELAVRVLDARDEAPVQGARVTLRVLHADPTRLALPGENDQSAITDADGRVRLSSRPGARGEIHVRHPAFASFESDEIELPAIGGIERAVRLSQGGTVVVDVLTHAGEPAVGVSVQHRQLDDLSVGEDGRAPSLPVGPRQRTDGEGRLRFERLPAGRHAFRTAGGAGGAFVFERPRHAGEELSPEWVEVGLAEGGEASVSLRLPARGSLAGRIQAGGAALAGANLALARATQEGAAGGLPLPGFGGASERSGGDGRYRFEELETGEYHLTLTHPARALPTRRTVRIEAGENRFDLALTEAVIEGRVEGADGRPLAARVTLELQDPSGPVRRDPPGMAETAGGVLAGADGRYVLGGVEPGLAVRVVARHEDHQSASSEELKLEDGQRLSGVDLRLQPGGRLDVRVVRADGAAPPFCRLVARFEGESEAPTPERREFVPEGGRLTLRGLRPGPWMVTVDALALDPGPEGAARAQPRRVEVVAGELRELELTLP